MTDPLEHGIRDSLQDAAGRVPLPERFVRPSALVGAAVERKRRGWNRLEGLVAAAAILLVGLVGATLATPAAMPLSRPQPPAQTSPLPAKLSAAAAQAAEVDQLRFDPPVDEIVISDHFGKREHPVTKAMAMHNGIDFQAETGDPVKAAAAGTVVVAGNYEVHGNLVVISHGKLNGKTITTWYAHNAELKVKEGQRVERGQPIALAGSTGFSSGPHLHFEVHEDGTPVDPMTWLLPASPADPSAPPQQAGQAEPANALLQASQGEPPEGFPALTLRPSPVTRSRLPQVDE